MNPYHPAIWAISIIAAIILGVWILGNGAFYPSVYTGNIQYVSVFDGSATITMNNSTTFVCNLTAPNTIPLLGLQVPTSPAIQIESLHVGQLVSIKQYGSYPEGGGTGGCLLQG